MVRFVFLKPDFEMTLKKNVSQETTTHIRKVISIDKVAGFKTGQFKVGENRLSLWEMGWTNPH